MKFINKLNIVILAVASLCLTASAQIAFDTYDIPYTLVVLSPTNYPIATGVCSNTVDIHGTRGGAKIDVTFMPDNTAGTLGYAIYGSTDKTNWTVYSACSYATATSFNVTNRYYGATNFYTADTFNLPGTITTPSASTAGFATTYLTAPTYTSTGTNLLTGSTVQTVGFSVQDAPRYLKFVATPGGSGTNFAVSAVMTTYFATPPWMK